MIEETSTQEKTLQDGRRVRVVIGWNYTLDRYWFVVYVQSPGRPEIHLPVTNALAMDAREAFDRAIQLAQAARLDS